MKRAFGALLPLIALLIIFSAYCLCLGADVPLNQNHEGYIRKQGNKRVLVFIHGLYGGVDTWRCDDKHYWPEMLAQDKDPSIANLDIYVASFPTPQKGGNETVADLETTVKNRLEADKIFSDHDEVVFVAHSLGGIIVQQILLTYRDEGFYRKVSFIYFYGTPQEGSKVAKLASIFSPDPLLKELSSGDGNFVLPDMNSKWIHAGFESIKRFCAYETKSVHGFKIVDRSSATRGCQDFVAIPANHISIVKPCSTRDDSYIALKNKLENTTLANTATQTQERSVPIASAPNGIANVNGTLINPSVTNLYNIPAPLPLVSWTAVKQERRQVPIMSPQDIHRLPVDKRMALQGPHTLVTLTLNSRFAHPAFQIQCERACVIKGLSLSFRNPRPYSEEHYLLRPEDGDQRIAAFYFEDPKVLSEGDKVLVDVESTDGNDVHITEALSISFP